LAATKASNLAEALLAFQKDAPALQKDAVNPHFKNDYISLDALMDAVLPVLNKHDLVVIQSPSYISSSEGTVPSLHTIIQHAPSGEKIEDSMPLFLSKNDPQGQGSAITYARRYSLMAILGLVADNDDDGEAAVRTVNKQPVTTNTGKRAF
jgi:hypothetical protein